MPLDYIDVMDAINQGKQTQQDLAQEWLEQFIHPLMKMMEIVGLEKAIAQWDAMGEEVHTIVKTNNPDEYERVKSMIDDARKEI